MKLLVGISFVTRDSESYCRDAEQVDENEASRSSALVRRLSLVDLVLGPW